MSSLKALDYFHYYWGPLTWKEAEKLLKPHADGTFLLRDSQDMCHLLTLSYKISDKIFHYRIQTGKNNCFLDNSLLEANLNIVTEISDSVNPLNLDVSFWHHHNVLYHNNSSDSIYENSNAIMTPTLPIPLHFNKPLKRKSCLFTLKYMCRFKILLCTKRKDLCKLNISNQLKTYLMDPRYIVEIKS